MSTSIQITGMGIVSSIGQNVDQCLDSLLHVRHGIGPIRILDTQHRDSLLVGEVGNSNAELADKLGLTSSDSYSRTSLLGLMAAREAFENANLSKKSNFRIGLVSSSSVGGIDRSEVFFRSYQQSPNSGRLRNIISHDCGDSTENIALDLGIHDFVSTISTACSSSANAIMFGARLIKNNMLDQVIVGGTDALTKYTLNGFNALRILDDGHCKPFDQHRKGLNLGEGAAYLVLESEETAKSRGALPIGSLIGYGNANDAFHQTASSPDGKGAIRSMSSALALSNLGINDIDYINAHGTGTEINDMSEGAAMNCIFNGEVPHFNSTKAFTGHTLAASGAIEAVLSLLMARGGFIVPNLNFKNPIEELNLRPVISLIKNLKIDNILSNSFGFGGNCSTLVLSRN